MQRGALFCTGTLPEQMGSGLVQELLCMLPLHTVQKEKSCKLQYEYISTSTEHCLWCALCLILHISFPVVTLDTVQVLVLWTPYLKWTADLLPSFLAAAVLLWHYRATWKELVLSSSSSWQDGE